VTRAYFVALSIVVTACAGPRTPQYHQKLVVIGIDSLDPDLVSKYMDEGKLPNMRKLARRGAFHRLETTPSADVSAWASFATGTNPGKHGVFGNGPQTSQYGEAFWTLAGRAGVRSSVLAVPLTFPPEAVPNGELLSGWPAPDIRETPGTYSYFATDVPQPGDGTDRSGGVRRRLTFNRDVARTVIDGPGLLTLPVLIFWNRAAKAATIDIDGSSVRLQEGEWSTWINVDFSATPLVHQRGMVEFLLIRAGSSFALYASPVHWRADSPPVPLSSPATLSGDLYDRVGPYRTLGWTDQAAALGANLIDEKAFMDDLDRAFDDRAQVILQRIDARQWDLLVGAIDSLDHVQHLMWRLTDPTHPAYDSAAAATFGDAIARIYRRCDALIGEVVKHIGPDTPLILMSAHGIKGFRQTVDLNRWLAEEGLAGNASVTASGGLFLSPAALAVEDHLIARLTALLDPRTQASIVAAVYKREVLYAGPYASIAPALQVGMAEGYRIGTSSAVLAPSLTKWSADHAALDYHAVPGTLISSRPITGGKPRVIDIAPTVLRYFGMPIPTEIDGTPLF
jgi:predicted AlkP superfamily phosphohydrolase/phosphomutase